MKKNVLPSDTAYIQDMYKFNQPLVYLPESFKEEADQYINSTGRVVEITTASEIYDELVAYFSN